MKRSSKHADRRSEAGVALVLVLTVTALMTIMAASYTLSMRRELDLVRNARDQAQAMALAEAGLNYAQLMLLVPDQLKRWRTDGTEYSHQLAGGEFKVKIIEETGKVDINKADLELLKSVVGSAGVEEEQIEDIVDAIRDWRDEDELVSMNGAEIGDYRSEGLPYHPRNADFQTIEELQLVMGITPEVYEKLTKLVTIYSQKEGIDPSKASREILLSLPGVDPQVVDTYLQNRQIAAENNEPAPVFPAVAGVKFVKDSGSVYSVEAAGFLKNGAVARVFTTITKPQGKSRGPFTILSWKKQFAIEKQKPPEDTADS